VYLGSCLCGMVKVKVHGPILDIIHCHCSLCRKSTGSAFATNGFVATDDFEVYEGFNVIKSFEFKPGRERHFCSNCASPIFSSNADDKGRIRLRLGLLDDDIVERPMSHNFVSSKANWDSLNMKLPEYESFEPSRVKN